MKAKLTEAIWIDTHHQVSLAELAELSGLSEAEIDALAEYGSIALADPAPGKHLFRAECIVSARAACRLRDAFGLDVHGIAVALALLDRVHGLEAELRELRALLPRAPMA